MSALDEINLQEMANINTQKLDEEINLLKEVSEELNNIDKMIEFITENRDLRTRIAELEKAVDEALSVICKGVQLMPLEKLSEWKGVRAWQEDYGKEQK